MLWRREEEDGGRSCLTKLNDESDDLPLDCSGRCNLIQINSNDGSIVVTVRLNYGELVGSKSKNWMEYEMDTSPNGVLYQAG